MERAQQRTDRKILRNPSHVTVQISLPKGKTQSLERSLAGMIPGPVLEITEPGMLPEYSLWERQRKKSSEQTQSSILETKQRPST